MSGQGFYISARSGRDQILQRDSDLVIDIYQLGIEPFETKPGRFVLYGYYRGGWIAFETDPPLIGLETYLISSALQWYAGILGNGEMDITLIDPRA